MRALVLIPDPGFPERWDWAFDVEAEALKQGGIDVVTRPWTDPGSVADADVVLPIVAWGYQFDTARWHRLLDALEADARCTLNPVAVLRWNSDKAYLVELAEAGVPTIATIRFDRFDEEALASARAQFGDEIVIKPPVSGGAFDTYRLDACDPVPEGANGRVMLAQPFYRAVQSEGEYSLLFFGGEFNHALIKRPRAGEYRVQPHLGGRETLCDAPAGGIALARSALAAAPAACAYARVDLLRDDSGLLRIIELELIEPAMWLELAAGAGSAFAAAIRAGAQE